MHKIVADTIDGLTGELTGTSIKLIKRKRVDRFVMLYVDNMELVMKIKGAMTFKLYLLMTKRMERDTNLIHITTMVKGELLRDMNATVATYTHSMRELIELGLVARISRGTYKLNPNIFFNGAQIKREEMI